MTDQNKAAEPQPESQQQQSDGQKRQYKKLTSAEIGALAHLYRGEVYRSTTWRTRLDNTTNWSVVTTGIAFSITFSGVNASPLPLVLVGLLVIVFLVFEAKRYRYFNVWRARARHMETEFYAPMLLGQDYERDGDWNAVLANDYLMPRHHISLIRAIGRRLRRSYAYLLAIQALAYYGKLTIHPTPITDIHDFFARAAIGPVSGQAVITAHLLFHLSWITVAVATLYHDKLSRLKRRYRGESMG